MWRRVKAKLEGRDSDLYAGDDRKMGVAEQVGVKWQLIFLCFELKLPNRVLLKIM